MESLVRKAIGDSKRTIKKIKAAAVKINFFIFLFLA